MPSCSVKVCKHYDKISAADIQSTSSKLCVDVNSSRYQDFKYAKITWQLYFAYTSIELSDNKYFKCISSWFFTQVTNWTRKVLVKACHYSFQVCKYLSIPAYLLDYTWFDTDCATTCLESLIWSYHWQFKLWLEFDLNLSPINFKSS